MELSYVLSYPYCLRRRFLNEYPYKSRFRF